MGTLKKLKLKMKMDKDLRHTLVRGTRDEILVDLDDDKQADLALVDTSGNGNVDTLAIDLTGDGEMNLFIVDVDGNGVPDTVLYDEDEDGDAKPLACGKDVEDAFKLAGQAVFAAIQLGDYIADVLDGALDDLEKQIKEARKMLK